MKKSELRKIIKEELNLNDFLTDDGERPDFRKIRGHFRLMLLNHRRDLEKLDFMRRAIRRGEHTDETTKIDQLINVVRQNVEKLIREIERYSHD